VKELLGVAEPFFLRFAAALFGLAAQLFGGGFDLLFLGLLLGQRLLGVGRRIEEHGDGKGERRRRQRQQRPAAQRDAKPLGDVQRLDATDSVLQQRLAGFGRQRWLVHRQRAREPLLQAEAAVDLNRRIQLAVSLAVDPNNRSQQARGQRSGRRIPRGETQRPVLVDCN
jgi:hypothetical protein